MKHLGEKGTDSLVNYTEAKFRMNNETLFKKLATKEDFAAMKGDISRLETDVSELKTEIAGLKTAVTWLQTDIEGLKRDVAGLKEAVTGMKMDFLNLQTKMEIRISGGKTEILCWMLTMFLVILLALIGLYAKI